MDISYYSNNLKISVLFEVQSKVSTGKIYLLLQPSLSVSHTQSLFQVDGREGASFCQHLHTDAHTHTNARACGKKMKKTDLLVH
jgi:hypothetical protein